MAKSISRRLADSASPTGAIDGTLSTAAQTNITSVGTLSSLAVSGTSTLTGAVGINIAPTSYKLTVHSGATAETTAAAIGYGGDAGTNLYINTDHVNNLVSLYASGSASKEMRFLSGSLEVMRLGTTGNVSIGTSLYPQKFNVLGTYENAGFYRDYSASGVAATYLQIGRKDSNGDLVSGVRISGGGDSGVAASHNGYFEIATRKAGTFVSLLSSYSGGSDLVVNEAGVDMDFRVESDNSTHALFVQGSDGNVGIGTASPDDMLDVENGNIRLRSNSDGNTGLFRMFDTAGTESGQIYAASGDLKIYSPNDVLFAQTGNVGIGTSSPVRKLHLEGTGASIHIQSTTQNQNSSIYFNSNVGGTQATRWEIGTNISAGANLEFFDRINSGSRMVIEPSGNVGIGTINPGALLDIGGAGTGGVLRVKGNVNNQVNIAHSSNNSWGMLLTNSDSSSNSGYHNSTSGVNSSVAVVNVSNDALHLGTNNDVRMTISHTGNVSITDGDLSFASGHGIDFSASSNYSASSSELLDDYEEGLWYPYLGTETQLGSPASTNYNNRYVKIGRLVKCTGWFNVWNYANVTSGTYMMIRNLPFPPEMHDTGMRFSYSNNIGNSTYGYGHTSLSGFYMMVGGSNGAPQHYNRSAAPTSGTAYSMINIVYYTGS